MRRLLNEQTHREHRDQADDRVCLMARLKRKKGSIRSE